jgi:hypothetical protein
MVEIRLGGLRPPVMMLGDLGLDGLGRQVMISGICPPVLKP